MKYSKSTSMRFPLELTARILHKTVSSLTGHLFWKLKSRMSESVSTTEMMTRFANLNNVLRTLCWSWNCLTSAVVESQSLTCSWFPAMFARRFESNVVEESAYFAEYSGWQVLDRAWRISVNNTSKRRCCCSSDRHSDTKWESNNRAKPRLSTSIQPYSGAAHNRVRN